jgi:hypothetical protein
MVVLPKTEDLAGTALSKHSIPGRSPATHPKGHRPNPPARHRLWGRAAFRKGWRKYHKRKNAQLKRSGLGIFRKIRRFMRKMYFFIFSR